jgi:hypothetical protein
VQRAIASFRDVQDKMKNGVAGLERARPRAFQCLDARLSGWWRNRLSLRLRSGARGDPKEQEHRT